MWGTEPYPFNGNIASPGYILKSVHYTQMTDTIKTQQGSGFTAVVTIIIDGAQAELTVEEDANIVPPTVGQRVVLAAPLSTASSAGLVPPLGGAGFTTAGFTILNNNLSGTRKEVNERVLLAEGWAAVPNSNAGGNPSVPNPLT